MALRGLFIGVDRFVSQRIRWLSCARRDACALHALFADTFGAGGVLLSEVAATQAAADTKPAGGGRTPHVSKRDPQDNVKMIIILFGLSAFMEDRLNPAAAP